MRPPSLMSGRRLLREQERSLEVDGELRVELRLRSVRQRRRGGCAGVVHQVVEAFGAEPRERVAHLGDEAIEAGGVAYVQLQRDAASAPVARTSETTSSASSRRLL